MGERAIRRSAVVRGSVQGVGFRYSARDIARELGVAGWVRNRADGAVELEAEGEVSGVTRLLDWAASGPQGAVVQAVDVTELEPRGDVGFDIRH